MKDKDDYYKVKIGLWWIIGRKRARKLRKRGEQVFWRRELDSYVWEPKR